MPDGPQRYYRYHKPEQHTLEKGPVAELLQRRSRQTGSDEKEGERETCLREVNEGVEDARKYQRSQVGPGRSSEQEKEDEPRHGDLCTLTVRAAAAINEREKESDRCDPESAGQFNSRRDHQGLGAERGGCSDDGAGIVNGYRRPDAELVLR